MFVAIETATDAGSVAIGSGAELVGEVAIGVRTRHAESLLPSLEFLLQSARLPRSAVTGIVVGSGPGSFTGVRVAAATARGLAHGLDVPLHAYSSLAALALQAAADRPVCALFDARRGEVYAACYVAADGSDALSALLEPTVLTIAALQERLAGLDPVFVGDGAVRYAAELGIVPPRPLAPRASALLRIAAADLAGDGTGRITDTAGWEPSYLRASGAERGIAG